MKKSYLFPVVKSILLFMAVFGVMDASAQSNQSSSKTNEVVHKFRISVPGIIIPQLFDKSWDDRTHTQHIELHFKYNLDDKNIIGAKFATWRLFQPMGIQWWDGLLDKVEDQSEFYPGHVREIGVGITYQRMLWKGLFATAEILPLHKTYLDLDNNKVGTGFKLYNSLHLGYHIPFGKKKQFFVEPQIHSQVWLFDTNTPKEFKELDCKWNNYFLFEPNIYLGIKF